MVARGTPGVAFGVGVPSPEGDAVALGRAVACSVSMVSTVVVPAGSETANDLAPDRTGDLGSVGGRGDGQAVAVHAHRAVGRGA